jgi:hypothetical protein
MLGAKSETHGNTSPTLPKRYGFGSATLLFYTYWVYGELAGIFKLIFHEAC